jgi:uncharacterized protein YidB (DUF937 family)
MSKTRTVVIGTLLAALAVLGGMAAAFFGAGPAVNAAPNAQDKGGTATAPNTQPANSDQDNAMRYLNLLDQKLATRLGISQSQLDTAITGAVGDTVDQAVADGKITQEQGTAIKTRVTGNGGGLAIFFKGLVSTVGEKPAMGPADGVDVVATMFNTAARVLGMTPDELKASLTSGQSITSLAQTHNVSLDTLKSAVLADLKTALDKAVTDGKLTQAERDAIYNKMSTGIDALLNGDLGGAKK